MEVCDSGHTEIVFHSDNMFGTCPLCQVIEELEEAKKERDELQSQIDDAD